MDRIEVTIRIALPDDAPHIAKLKYDNLMARTKAGIFHMTPLEWVGEELTDENLIALRSCIEHSSEEDCHLVAIADGTIVGFCRMGWCAEEQHVRIRRFYVRVDLIGRKIGGQIMAEVKRRAQTFRDKVLGISLYTAFHNASAQAMYVHWGFVYAPRTESVFDEREDGTTEYVKMIFTFA